MSEPRGPEDPTNRWIAGKIDELLQGLHPEDEALVLEYLGLNKLDSGTIDPPPVRRAMGTDPSRETLSKKSHTQTKDAKDACKEEERQAASS